MERDTEARDLDLDSAFAGWRKGSEMLQTDARGSGMRRREEMEVTRLPIQ